MNVQIVFICDELTKSQKNEVWKKNQEWDLT